MKATNYILFDPTGHRRLLPLAYTRAVAGFRVGIFTIKEKWELRLGKTVEVLTRNYLQPLYGLDEIPGARNIYINASILPDDLLTERIEQLAEGESLAGDDQLIAACMSNFHASLDEFREIEYREKAIDYNGEISAVKHNWDIYLLNGEQIVADSALLAIDGNGEEATAALAVHSANKVFIEEGAEVESVVINASDGPVFIGRGARIMDGAILRGPVAVCHNAVVKMGAKIYPDTTIGPYCKVGGEVSNSVLFGYSNKGHDGYLGNSVLGEWCNLGADTNTSNLKNNYAAIKCWDYETGGILDTGLQFCGLIMGDHAKSGINTMFNTGTVVGVAANVFGDGFPPKFIPSFSWGGQQAGVEFRLEKVFEMAERMMARRQVDFTDGDRSILENIFNETGKYRK
jgi:UDP-N-acetylglucosamine diphosphorylase/glucosamine-1-phosphate N-acetyltransferase